jgi:hypothetical protein
VKHDVQGLRFKQSGRGLMASGSHNGPGYRLERTIHSKTGRHYWEVFWCPSGMWQNQKQHVRIGRDHRRVECIRVAEIHAATQRDDYYLQQLEETCQK